MNWFRGIAGIGLLLLAILLLNGTGFNCFTILLLGASLYFLLSGASQKKISDQAKEQRSNGRDQSFDKHGNDTITISIHYTTGESEFVKQARQHVKRRSKSTRHVKFKTYWPTYDDMSPDQQSWYFYWRDQVRHGRYPDTSLSYIFLHVYELINNVGVTNADDGYRQLRQLWLNYRERFPNLDHYLADWITDYLTVNSSSHDPLSIYADPELQPVLSASSPDLVLHAFLTGPSPIRELPLILLDALTDHKIQKSRFYRNGYDDVIHTTLKRVLEAVDEHLQRKKEKGIFQLYRPKKRVQVERDIFRSALYDGPSKTITIARVYPYSSHPPLRQFLTAVVKYTENLLRKSCSFSGRLKVPSLHHDVAAIIEKTVSSHATVTTGATEFVVKDRRRGENPGTAVPIPPQKIPATPSPGKLRIVSKKYLNVAQKLASRRAKRGKLVPLETPFTSFSYDYRDLTRKQAKWYFYWRNQVRHGQYPDTDPSYIFIHAPELIHLVGVDDANDAYQQLRALWLNYRERHPKIEPYLLGWMLSFVTVHECDVTPRYVLLQPEAYNFTRTVAPDILLTQYKDERFHEIPLDLLDQFIDHDIQRSSFYCPEHQDLMQRMLPAAVAIVNKREKKEGNGSLFTRYRAHPVVVEVRKCWRATQTYGEWPTQIIFKDIPAYSQHNKLRHQLTGIVKYAENKLREEKNHRGRLRVRGIDEQTPALIDRLITQNDAIINPPPPAPAIEIDLSRIETLRAESEEVLEMLQTNKDEATINTSSAPAPELPEVSGNQVLPEEKNLPESIISMPDVGTESEMWTQMAKSLDDHQVEALAAILNSNDPQAAIHRIASKQFLMPTMLIDSINELAQDTIGDILIESDDVPQLIDDYYEPMIANIIEKRRSA